MENSKITLEKLIGGLAVALLVIWLLLGLSHTSCQKRNPIVVEGDLGGVKVSLRIPSLDKPSQLDFDICFTVNVEGGGSTVREMEVRNYRVQGNLEVPARKHVWIYAEAEINAQTYRGESDTLYLQPSTLTTIQLTLDPAIGPGPNHPPDPPSDPHPPDGASDQPVNVGLSWSCSDPDTGDVLSFDVYLGSDTTLELVSYSQTEMSYQPPEGLEPNTTYYWRIVARDSNYDQSEGPLWHFTTSDYVNQAPFPPTEPYPPDGATNQPQNVSLMWSCSDPDSGDVLTYDVYFGSEAEPPLVSEGQYENFFDPGPLSTRALYKWKIVATDNHGASASGPLWSFSTVGYQNQPPLPPSNPYPPDGAADQSVDIAVSWSCSDPDPGDSLNYDVYFGTDYPPPLVSQVQTDTTYDPPGSLDYSGTYFWKIVARDSHNHETEGPLWSFTTEAFANLPPLPPSNPIPPEGAGNQSTEVDLYWTCTDPDSGDTLTYDVYFGASPDPALVSTGRYENYYDPGTLFPNTFYYWRIVAWDSHGASTTGPLWNFATAPDSIVIFPDPNLERAVRDHINKPVGDIYVSDVDTIANFRADTTNIQSIVGLEYFLSTISLRLWGNEIVDIDPLEGLINLTRLWLPVNQISDLSPLQNLSQVELLDLASNQISNLTPLQSLSSVKYLNLPANPISNLTPLSNLTQLLSLRLSMCQITDVTPLGVLTNLRVLWLFDNQITDITPVGNLVALNSLRISQNPIADLTPLQNLAELTTLRAAACGFSDITALEYLTSLDTLDLSTNSIQDITPIENLDHLVRLDLDSTGQMDIAPLEYITEIITLELRYNQIEDLLPLSRNNGMNSGDTLDVRDNPLNGTSRGEVIPRLQQRGVTVYYDP